MKPDAMLGQRQTMTQGELWASAIKGLMLLGRTREQAVQELWEAERKENRKAELDWYNGGFEA